MRNILICIVLIIGLAACENQEQEFPDYDLQAVYFPIQLPIRTLSLGEDRIDNTLDKEHKFDIGVSIGGMYENKNNWTVDYVVDTSLTENATSGNGDLIALPANYYTLSPINTVVIPKGSFNGLIRVELTDEFFNDPLSLTGQYVIPLRITGTSADSVLSGKQAKPGVADRRVLSDWESGKAPKDWVLYGIKYVNAYHGTYLHRGRDIVYNSGGVPIDTIIFRNRYVERDMTILLTTTGLVSVASNGIGNKTSKTGKYSMGLEFGNSQGAPGAIIITPRVGSTWAVTGTGDYFDIANSIESWTGMKWQSMYLDYTYTEGTNVHQVADTLVFRDRGMKYEVNTITIAK